MHDKGTYICADRVAEAIIQKALPVGKTVKLPKTEKGKLQQRIRYLESDIELLVHKRQGITDQEDADRAGTTLKFKQGELAKAKQKIESMRAARGLV